MCALGGNEGPNCDIDHSNIPLVACENGEYESLHHSDQTDVMLFKGDVRCGASCPYGNFFPIDSISGGVCAGVRVVLKCYTGDLGEYAQSVQREAYFHKVMADAGVTVPLCGLGEWDTLFMLYNDEQSLSQFLHRLPYAMNLPPEASGVLLPLALDCAEKLARVHALGIIHRDIKPANIVCDPNGEPLIIDWESADQCKEGETVPNGQLPFTPQYAAWERILRDKASPASDVFSLGLVFLAIFSRDHVSPLEEAFHREAIRADIRDDDPDKGFLMAKAFWEHKPQETLQSLLQTSSLLFPAMQPLLTAMLQMRPADRPSAAQVKQALEQLLEEYIQKKGFDPDFWQILYASICEPKTHPRFAEWSEWVQKQCATPAKPVAT